MFETEQLVWSAMKQFESLAVELYQVHFPALAHPAKLDFVGALAERVPSSAALDGSELAAPTRALLQAAHGKDAHSVLLVQGLLLEQMGQVIYDGLARRDRVTAPSRELAQRGLDASRQTSRLVPALAAETIGRGAPLFQALVSSTGDFLVLLDKFGESLDQLVGVPLELRFSEVMGDLTAELIPICVDLGIDRRKLICHLTGALMGAG